MNVTINLPLLKLRNCDYSEETLRSEEFGRIEMWRDAELKTIAASISVASDMFFQTELDVDDEFLKQTGTDADKLTFIIIGQMFSDLYKVTALQQHLEVRFDEITPDREPKIGGHTYSVDGTEYDVYYNSEVIEIAREFQIEYMKNSSISDVIGDIEYIEDFFGAINIKLLSKFIRTKIEEDELEDFVPDEAMEDNKKLILWMAKEDEEFVLDKLEKCFDYDKMAELDINSVDEAVTQMNSYSEHLFSDTISVDGSTKKFVHIFRRY